MAKEAELDRSLLEQYLRHRWRTDAVTITGLVRFTRGISRETWSVECRNEDDDADGDAGRPAKLILRRDLPGNSIDPHSLRFEYEVYSRMARTPVPVARPLWYETDPDWLSGGREFYLREQVEGSWDVPHARSQDPAHDRHRIEISREHIRNLALVHACDWRALGFDEILQVPDSPETCARHAIDRHFRVLDEIRISPLPVLYEAREWLYDHAPPAPRITLLKGCNGLGEEVFRDGRIVAMSDWEQCSLGDPASDIARTQDFIPSIVRDGRVLWGIEPALDYYAEISGTRLTAATVHYYRLLNSVESVQNLHHGVVPICNGTDLNARLSWLGTETIHRFNKLLMDLVSGRPTDYCADFYNERPAKI